MAADAGTGPATLIPAVGGKEAPVDVTQRRARQVFFDDVLEIRRDQVSQRLASRLNQARNRDRIPELLFDAIL